MGEIKSGMPQIKQVVLSDLDHELDLLKLKITESVNKIEHPERALVSEFVPAKKAAKLIGILCTRPQKYTGEIGSERKFIMDRRTHTCIQA